MLQKNSGGAAFERTQRACVAHPGGHHQDAAGEALLTSSFQERQPLLLAQVVVQQNHVDLFLVENSQRFRCGTASSGDPKIRFGLEQPAEALAEQAVIVH